MVDCQDCVYHRCGRENHTYARDCPDFKLPEEKKPTHMQYFNTQCFHCGKTIYVKVQFSQDFEEKEKND